MDLECPRFRQEAQGQHLTGACRPDFNAAGRPLWPHRGALVVSRDKASGTVSLLCRLSDTHWSGDPSL